MKLLKNIRGLFGIRLAVAAVFMMVSLSFAQIDQDTFTDVATTVLEYLGYAIVAGLTVLVAVIGARKAWAFMRRFI